MPSSPAVNERNNSQDGCILYYHLANTEDLQEKTITSDIIAYTPKKGKRKVQGVPQSQTSALPRHQEEEETDKSKQAQIEQMYGKH